MTTYFKPKNKIKGIVINVAGAEFLRSIIGDDADISGVGCPRRLYTNAEVSEQYSETLFRFLANQPVNYKHAKFIREKAIFFNECGGFWQS